MDVVGTFGKYVDQWSENAPARARWLLKTGWQAQDLRYHFLPEKRLSKGDQYLADYMMRMMIRPLKAPEQSVLVSVFTPCELIQEAGLYPYNVESFSCYLTGSRAERAFLQDAEDAGLSETLCSYHKTFIGAALSGVLPKPKCIVYTNLACDANLLTFRYLSNFYQVPAFAIDVPAAQTQANVDYVTQQLHEMEAFLELHTGRKIDPDALRERVERGRRTLKKFDRFQTQRADKYIMTDLVSPMYVGMTNNIFLGMEEEEHLVDLMLDSLKSAPPAKGKRIYWMHTIPFWSQAVRDALALKEDIQIVGCEIAQTVDPDIVYEDPYEQMAARLVYHSLNGSITRRIDAGIRHTRQAGADGAVWFNHWGCKHTLGGSQLARRKFEEAGIPLLVLDGDGVDRSHGGEGQTATRLGAFLEMLTEDHEAVRKITEEAAEDVDGAACHACCMGAAEADAAGGGTAHE